jgi:hypothetical protein
VGALLGILLFLFFVALPVVALFTQVIPLRLGDVTFHDTDPTHAWWLVAGYARGTFEQRFGYPSGYFVVDENRSQLPARILVREAQPAGSITDGCSVQISSLSLAGFEEGCGAGCLMFMAVSFIGAPFLFVSTFDRVFRLILRSRIDIRLRASGPDTVASVAFYGPGGYLLRGRYAQVFERPELPAELETGSVTPGEVRQASGRAA